MLNSIISRLLISSSFYDNSCFSLFLSTIHKPCEMISTWFPPDGGKMSSLVISLVTGIPPPMPSSNYVWEHSRTTGSTALPLSWLPINRGQLQASGGNIMGWQKCYKKRRIIKTHFCCFWISLRKKDLEVQIWVPCSSGRKNLRLSNC